MALKRPKLKPPDTIKSREDLFWEDTYGLIKRGAVLPVVSNSILTTIFGNDPTAIATTWAQEIGSPLSAQENRDLTRVAHYCSVQKKSPRNAKLEYHKAIRDYLLGLAQNDPDADTDYIDNLYQKSFSEIARNLGYPKFPDHNHNPLRLLAELPLPIYLTTSHHTFLETALTQTNRKKPVTEIFYWDDALYTISSIFDKDSGYIPSVERPLVYHLFGVDTYPESLVLSEDDYLRILVKLSSLKPNVKVSESAAGEESGAKYDLPSDIKIALNGAGLLLLGYPIYEWEFRVLFTWLVQYTSASRQGLNAPNGISVQVKPTPGEQDEEAITRLKAYLEGFFDQQKFKIYWGDMDTCVHDLWTRWIGSVDTLDWKGGNP